MNQCYLCGDPLVNENESLEHILPNSIGGRLKSKSLICKGCNNTTGQLFDAEFARFANVLASKHPIKRETGSVQPMQAINVNTGEKLVVQPGYKINYLEPRAFVTDSIVNVIHYDKKRATEELKKLSKQVNGKIPAEQEIQFEFIENNAQVTFLIDQPVEPSLLLRSVCKTVINFYLHQTQDIDNCGPLLNFLKTDTENFFCWFLDLHLSSFVHSQAPYHSLLIRGEKKSKMLYAYFEIFGELGFIVLINGNYGGEERVLNYTFDPVQGIEIPAEYSFNLKSSDIFDHLINKPDTTHVNKRYH